MVNNKETAIDRTFHALADPTRRRILKMLSDRDQRASELARKFDISFPAVSKHLKVLEKAGLIKREVRGRIHRFNLEAQAMEKAHRWIQFYEKYWLESLGKLDTFLQKQKRKGDH